MLIRNNIAAGEKEEFIEINDGYGSRVVYEYLLDMDGNSDATFGDQCLHLKSKQDQLTISVQEMYQIFSIGGVEEIGGHMIQIFYLFGCEINDINGNENDYIGQYIGKVRQKGMKIMKKQLCSSDYVIKLFDEMGHPHLMLKKSDDMIWIDVMADNRYYNEHLSKSYVATLISIYISFWLSGT